MDCSRRHAMLSVALAAILLPGPMLAVTHYDPLAVDANISIQTLDLTVHNQNRDRDIPVFVYLPPSEGPAPVVLFSHGLGGSRMGSAYLAEHWARRGYLTVFLQHPGSDVDVWQNERPLRRMAALRRAANAQNLLLRVADVRATLDQLEAWNADEGHPLHGRVDMDHVGMSGHSFGAVTTQAVSGQTIGARQFALLTDPRIDAAIIMSPSSPRQGSPEQAFSKVKIPWMLMTGTNDVAPIGDADMESRLAVFPALPPGDKYEVVLDGAEHSAFTERALPGDSQPRNPNHHRVILALSTAFWDAYLMDDPDAREWLEGDGPRSVMESGDRWQKK